MNIGIIWVHSCVCLHDKYAEITGDVHNIPFQKYHTTISLMDLPCLIFHGRNAEWGQDVVRERMMMQWQYIRDSGIQILANELSEICSLRMLLFRSEFQCTDRQIKYKIYQTKSFLVLCCLQFSIFVYFFWYLYTHFYSFNLTEELQR